MNDTATDDQQRQLAEAVRTACVHAALEAYDSASMSGLCHDGAWECAVGAIRALDVEDFIRARNARDSR